MVVESSDYDILYKYDKELQDKISINFVRIWRSVWPIVVMACCRFSNEERELKLDFLLLCFPQRLGLGIIKNLIPLPLKFVTMHKVHLSTF
jgi:hypothetical protein